MPRPPVALNFGFVFLLFVIQTLGLLGHMFRPHLPALPDRRQQSGGFV